MQAPADVNRFAAARKSYSVIGAMKIASADQPGMGFGGEKALHAPNVQRGFASHSWTRMETTKGKSSGKN